MLSSLSTRLLLMLGLAMPLAASAHAVIQRAQPAADTVVAAPHMVRIDFTEPLEPAFSSIVVRNAQGQPVTADKAAVPSDAPRSLTLVLPPLPAGSYQVEWRTLARDGHRTGGNYRFKVR